MDFEVELYKSDGNFCAYIGSANASGYECVGGSPEDCANQIKEFFLNEWDNYAEADIEVGSSVKWNDPAINDFAPEEREMQRNRIFKVVEFINEDMVLIADEFGESEVFVGELELVEN